MAINRGLVGVLSVILASIAIAGWPRAVSGVPAEGPEPVTHRIRAQLVEIVDSEGKVRASLGMGGVESEGPLIDSSVNWSLLDKKGNVIVRIAVTDDGMAGIAVRGSSGKHLISMIASEGVGTELVVSNGELNRGVSVHALKGKDPEVEVHQGAGKSVRIPDLPK